MNRSLPKLDLNVTNRCNLRCKHCAFDSGVQKYLELSLNKIRQILAGTKKLGGQRIDITGGEPLMRKDIPEIIHIAKSLGFKVELITNATMLTSKKLQIYKQLGLDSMAVSLDGPDFNTPAEIRGITKQQYKYVLAAIEKILAIGIPLKINTVAFASNYKRLPELTKWCIRKGVVEHGIYYYTSIGRGEKSNLKSVEPSKWLAFIRKSLTGLSKKIKVSIEVPFIEKNKLNGRPIACLADCEQYHLQILPDGNVYPCAIMASYNLPLGNLHKDSIGTIWNDPKIWEDYWKKATKIFSRCQGSCVNFSQSFDSERYGTKFKPVCPIRKFLPGDIL